MKLSETVNRKFIESVPISGKVEVLSDTGWIEVYKSHKTIEYQVYILRLSDGRFLECADDHIVFNMYMEEVFVKDLCEGDIVLTDTGPCEVECVEITSRWEHMYDLEVGGNNRYYTNGILSHNTTTLGLIALHGAIFNPDYIVGISSFTVNNIRDIMNRVKYTYENLPDWLKPPIKTYNTTTVEFTNNSMIYGQVTSENALRGRSNNMVIVDEFAFVTHAVAEEFYIAILPSLTASGEDSTTKAVFISTPNGTTGKFAEIAFGAMAGENGFIYHLVDHTKIPGRTPKFRQDMINKLGRNKYEQEYECIGGESKVWVEINGVMRHLRVDELYDLMEE